MNGEDSIKKPKTQVNDVLAPEKPRKLSLSDFKKLFGGQGMTPSALRRVSQMGLIEIHGLSVQVKSPRLMDIGLELLQIGIPMGEMLDELAALKEAEDAIAGRFIDLFERDLWKPFVAAGLPAEQVEPLADSLERLTSVASRAVDAVLRDTLRARAEAFIGTQSEHFESEETMTRLIPLARAAGLDL
ncbi:MAG: hypothetical protein FWE35_23940 [Streptosporangiales bacterium]|nr:hypothetical protein [Streptosporangiales bacterium]